MKAHDELGIIGSGSAGLTADAEAARFGSRTPLLEKTDRPGRGFPAL